MTIEEKKTKENDEKTKKYIDKVFQSISELYNAEPIHLNQHDKSYFIGWAIARNQQNDLNAIWALEAILDAFNSEQNEYNKLKSDSRDRLLEKINNFKNNLEDDSQLLDKKNNTIQ